MLGVPFRTHRARVLLWLVVRAFQVQKIRLVLKKITPYNLDYRA